MKKILFITLSIFTTGLATTAWVYNGPWDERMPPGHNNYEATIGFYAQNLTMAAVADVIVDTPHDDHYDPEQPYKTGSITVRVVNAIYGCTNGQEIVLKKDDPIWGDMRQNYDPNFEYFPTNNSRIVVIGTGDGGRPQYKLEKWNTPPEPEVIVSTNDWLSIEHFTRSWWYDGYQDNLPYIHLTNLVQVTRRERNWTNSYHIVRDSVPNPSNRVWKDSFHDLEMLYIYGSPEQIKHMYNDPLLDNDVRTNLKNWNTRTATPIVLDD